jgi:hypothetical protein
MSSTNMKEVAVQTIFAAPPATVLLTNITMEQWKSGLAIGLLLLQAAYLIWKWNKESKNKDRDK